MIKKIISGGQTGADQAGLSVAKCFEIPTGGWAPKGFRTLRGDNLQLRDLYNLEETSTSSYSFRTGLNVANSDGTMRFAVNFKSAGEICTLKHIKNHKKPYFDVDLSDTPEIEKAVAWIYDNKIEVLNIAGNSEQTFEGCFSKTSSFLKNVLFELGFTFKIHRDALLNAVGATNRAIYCNGKEFDYLEVKKYE